MSLAANAWQRELGPTLGPEDVRALPGRDSVEHVEHQVAARRLIALHDRAGRLCFPVFQFDGDNVIEALVEAFWTLADSTTSRWTAAAWCVAPDSEALDGLTPAQWARHGDPERQALVARRDAARLAR